MKLFFLSTLLVFIISCHSGNMPNPKTFRNLSDTSWFDLIREKATKLSLPKITQGVDSFELRFWTNYSLTDLKFSGSVWQLTRTLFRITYENENRDMVLDTAVARTITPKIGYSKLIDSIEHFNIAQIPSQSQILGFIDNSWDGMTYTCEVATKNYYKMIVYHNPKSYSDSIHQKVNKLFDFFNRNIGEEIIY